MFSGLSRRTNLTRSTRQNLSRTTTHPKPPVATWGIRPEKFAHLDTFALDKRLVYALLAIFVIAGFGLRAANLSAEGLSEDELNKLQAVGDYREYGLSPANAEHPMLMKAVQTVSVVLSEQWNEVVTGSDENLSASPVSALQESARRRNAANDSGAAQELNGFQYQSAPAGDARASSPLRISPETALRLPAVIFGALTALLIFFVTRSLFGATIALIAAGLWSVDPTAISFNRIAKEDTFFIFFFLLANVFWLKAQVRAERDEGDFNPLMWATAACLGAMVASKYYPHFITIPAAYYYLFLGLPTTRWHIGKPRWLIFIFVMGGAFVICNLTILLPGTWVEMRTFATERRIAHDAYEYIGALYPNQITYWLRGVPPTFYFFFTLVKFPLLTLAGFLAGLTFLFRRKLGDGRYLLLIWLLFFFIPFSLLGGKFARYYTLVMPPVIITSAIGIYFAARFIALRFHHATTRNLVALTLVSIVLILSLVASLRAAPYYRLYNNLPGGGRAHAGEFFPHDDFYDASMRDAAFEIARRAAPNARVASESPRLLLHYAALAGRTDLRAVSLSDPAARSEMEAGDYVIAARGRRYFSNDAILRRLQATSAPVVELSLGDIPSAKIFQLDAASTNIVRR